MSRNGLRLLFLVMILGAWLAGAAPIKADQTCVNTGEGNYTCGTVTYSPEGNPYAIDKATLINTPAGTSGQNTVDYYDYSLQWYGAPCHATSNNCGSVACGSVCTDSCGGVNITSCTTNETTTFTGLTQDQISQTGADPNCATACGWNGCGCPRPEGWKPGKPCKEGNCCAWGGCSYSPGAPVRLKSPANGATVPAGDVTVAWYNNNWTTTQQCYCARGGENKRGEWVCRETRCDNVEVPYSYESTVCIRWGNNKDGEDVCKEYGSTTVTPPYTFGSRACGPCSSGGEYTAGTGWFVVQLGSSPGNLRSVASVQNTDSYTLPESVLTGGTNYWRIMATGEWSTTYSDTWSFNAPPPNVTVSGTVYEGSGGGLNKCTGPGTPFKPGGGSKVRVNPDAREGPVEGNGSYQVSQVVESGAKTIVLSGMDSGYYCSCPGSCQYSANLQLSGISGWNFYVSNILSKWAQVVGGHVHGQTGTTVEVPAGNYFMIKSPVSNQPGAGTKVSGNFNVFPGSLSTTNWNLTDALSQTTWRYAYQRLWVRAGSPTTDPGDGFTSVPEPGIYRKTDDWAVNSSGWQNLAGERVIFVDGDLTIKYKITLSGANDFLAFIVSGDINVDPGVGDGAIASPTPSNADLVGAFLANGSFNGGSTASRSDKQLVIYGTVGADIDLNGSGRVRFQRDMGINNRVGPGVAVIWNPNLLLNFPDQLTDALTDWREVAP